MSQLYRYHPDTGVYLGVLTARLDPLETQKAQAVRYMRVPHTTVTPPPAVPVGKRARWQNNNWVLEDLPLAQDTTATTTKRLANASFVRALEVQFPGVQWSSSAALGSANEKVITLFDHPATADNTSALVAVIEAHVYENEVLEDVRVLRNTKLMVCDWVAQRHTDQKAASATTTITEEKYQEWLTYRQALRDFPTVCNPLAPTWPEEPS